MNGYSGDGTVIKTGRHSVRETPLHIMRNHLTGLGMVGHVKPKADARTLRTAAIYTLGFLVVLLISLVVAQGSEGQPRSTLGGG